METTTTDAAGAGTPTAISALAEAGPSERGTRIIVRGKPLSALKTRKGFVPVAGWLLPVAAQYGISSPQRAPVGRYTNALAEHQQWRRQEGCLPDSGRQATWRKVLAECAGDAARADVVLAARLNGVAATTSHPPWRKTLAACGGNAVWADLVVARLQAASEKPASQTSKDWDIRAPGPDPKVVKWLRESRVEWAARLSKIRDTHCEQCGVRVTLARPRKRIFCGEQCSRDWYNANRPKVQHAERACQECSTGFMPTRADSKFCSDACRQRAHRKGPKILSLIRDSAPEITAIGVPEFARHQYAPLSHHRMAPIGRAA